MATQPLPIHIDGGCVSALRRAHQTQLLECGYAVIQANFLDDPAALEPRHNRPGKLHFPAGNGWQRSGEEITEPRPCMRAAALPPPTIWSPSATRSEVPVNGRSGNASLKPDLFRRTTDTLTWPFHCHGGRRPTSHVVFIPAKDVDTDRRRHGHCGVSAMSLVDPPRSASAVTVPGSPVVTQVTKYDVGGTS